MHWGRQYGSMIIGRCVDTLASRDEAKKAPGKPASSAGGRSSVQSVVHALDIFDYLASSGGEAGVTELAQSLHIHKSTASRLLATLNARGYVSRNPQSGKYSLGMHLVELSRVKLDQIDLRQLARPYLEDLVSSTGETAHMAVLDRGKVVYIDKVDTLQTLGMRSRIGYRIAAHCTALGKALLAELPAEELDAVLDPDKMVRFTSNTITDLDTLKLHLASVRERGYAIDDEEHEDGIRCIAAAIRDHAGRVVAAISVSGPTFRITREKADTIGRLVSDAARQLSASAGYAGPRRHV